MIFFKSVIAGILAAPIAVVFWVFAGIAIQLLGLSLTDAGSGGFGFIVMSGEIVLAAIAGFALGFTWQFRRLKRRTAAGR